MSFFRFLTVFAVLAASALITPLHAAPGRAKIVGGTVRSDQGALLRGPFIKLVNRTIYTVGSADPALYKPAYWQPYKEMGFNNVRIVVAWGSSYKGFSAPETLKALDELVALFSSMGMYVTVCGSAHDYDWFHKADLEDFWKNMAPRYKDRANVLYEIQNEPMGDPNGFLSKTTPPKGTGADLVAIHQSVRAAAPETIIGMWGFAKLGPPTNDAGWAIKSNDKEGVISYEKTAVAFHYYPPTNGAFVDALKKTYPLWMTEGSDEAPGGSPDCDLAWYLDCEKKGISWNAMDFKDTLLKCKVIKAYLTAYGYGWDAAGKSMAAPGK